MGGERERGRGGERERVGGENCSLKICLEVSVVVDMASVGVSSHQGRAYGAQSEPRQVLHSSGAACLLPRPLGPRPSLD